MVSFKNEIVNTHLHWKPVMFPMPNIDTISYKLKIVTILNTNVFFKGF